MILARRDLRAAGVVAALSSGFGVLLLQGTWLLTGFIAGDDVAQHPSVLLALTLVAVVFFAIALFVGAIVTANTVNTVIAGAARDIARLRLLGATATTLRRSISLTGLAAAVVGSVVGAALFALIDMAAVSASISAGLIEDRDYQLFSWLLLAPVAATIIVSLGSVWIGSRHVLAVTPIEAIGHTGESTPEHGGHRHAATGFTLIISGGALLAGGIVVGQLTQLGLLIAMLGGILSFTGIIVLAGRLMPPILWLVGRATSVGPSSRLAASNALRSPARSSRATIGMVVGVTLVTMFWVAMQTYFDVIIGAQSQNPELYSGIDESLSVSITVFSVLLGFSAVIAAVGLVNTLSLSVLQRRRELGLLRALGLSRHQVRAMITAESVNMTVSALVVGLLLGIIYGWCGAMALLGSIPHSSFVIPVVPPAVLAVLVGAGLLLSIGAAVLPVQRTLHTAPVAALAGE